ncbi:hypothetical protein HYH03_017370 [Edaphochlamys debaryana]|uniref:Uncharacterized protein n=1 Tax=Edaphochlamys debaryana TaxID=47281 RepID=A0A835XJ61_9CHLO|nr:hypothetical protein HYH03_017370 [Edaphochlamys debaryana]|eukprot:KAG2483773.1 hypothetical protein HYH03_017370 [Edaphochlamys debaryana]
MDEPPEGAAFTNKPDVSAHAAWLLTEEGGGHVGPGQRGACCAGLHGVQSPRAVLTEGPTRGAAPSRALTEAVASILTLAQSEAAAAAAGAGELAAAAGPGGRPASRPSMVYRSPIQRCTLQMKIAGVEPDQVVPGFQARLAALAQERGLRLAGAYVRAGCIELLLVLERAEGAQGVEAWELASDPALQARAVVTALGLYQALAAAVEARSGGSGADGRATEDDILRQIELRDQRTITPVPLPLPAAAAGADGAVTVACLTPRVLCLASGSAGGAAEADPVPALPRLRMALHVSGAAAAAAEVAVSAMVRCGGRHLAARVTPVPGGGGGGSGGEELPYGVREYDIQLLAAPQPGLVLVEFVTAGPEVDSPPVRHALLPLLATGDPAIAAEVQATADAWPAEQLDELSELLYDMATWTAVVHSCAADEAAAKPEGGAQPAAAPPAWVNAGVGAGGAGSGSRSGSALSDPVASIWSTLVPHLLAFAEAADLPVTAARLRSDLARDPPSKPAGAGAPAASSPGARARAIADAHAEVQPEAYSSVPGKIVDSDSEEAAMAALLDSGSRRTSCELDADGALAGRAGGHGRRQRPPWLRALLRVLSLERVPRAEEAAFRAYADGWSATLGHTAQVTEALALMTFLVRGLRAGQAVASGEGAIVIVGIGTGFLTTLAWLVLPYAAWVRLVRAARVPRYIGYCISKSLLEVFRPPVGAAEYAAGPGMLLLEGMLLPGAFLLAPRTYAFIAIIKFVLNLRAAFALGITTSPLLAFLIAARVEVAALATTIACYIYIYMRYERLTYERRNLAAGEGGSAHGAYGARRSCSLDLAAAPPAAPGGSASGSSGAAAAAPMLRVGAAAVGVVGGSARPGVKGVKED